VRVRLQRPGEQNARQAGWLAGWQPGWARSRSAQRAAANGHASFQIPKRGGGQLRRGAWRRTSLPFIAIDPYEPLVTVPARALSGRASPL
jgi:hypothetical protein